MWSRPHRDVALLALALSLGGCVTWRPATVAPRELIEAEQPERIRVTRPDNSTLIVSDPTVVNDSVATVLEDCETSVAGGRFDCRVVDVIPIIALEDVRSLEVQRVAAGRTLGLVLMVPVAAVVFAYVYIIASGGL